MVHSQSRNSGSSIDLGRPILNCNPLNKPFLLLVGFIGCFLFCLFVLFIFIIFLQNEIFAWMDSCMHAWCPREIVHLHVHAGNQILVLCNNN